jgi:hypothetical protein
MTTLTIATACWGEPYAQFIPRFWQGVASLNKKPDEIILGIEQDDIAGFASSIPDGYNTKIHVFESDNFQTRWLEVMMLATSDWLIGIAVDDELLPEAFDELDQADEQDADIYVDSIIVRQSGQRAVGAWDTSNLAHKMPCPGGPATKKDLFKQIGFKTELRWIDWIFLIDAVKLGAKPYISKTTRIIYDDGQDRNTWSSVCMDATKRQAYCDEVTAYAKSLGF